MTPEKARTALAAAHERMTPTEIAAHALALAEALAEARHGIERGVVCANQLASALRTAQLALVVEHEGIRSINELFATNKKREAREVLWRRASAPKLEPEPMPLLAMPQWPADTFNPVGKD